MRRERIVMDPTRNNEQVTDDLLNRGFEGATIAQMGLAVDTIIAKVRDKYPEAGALEQYRAIAARLPGRIDSEVRQRVLQAVNDPDTSTTARRVFVMFYVKSVLAAIQPYLWHDPDENDDIVQAAMTHVYARVEEIPTYGYPNVRVDRFAREGVGHYLESMQDVRVSWVTTGKYSAIMTAIQQIDRKYPDGLDRIQIAYYARKIAKQAGVGEDSVKDYLTHKLSRSRLIPVDPEGIGIKAFGGVLDTLPDKQKKVIELRFGRTDGRSDTLEEVAEALGLLKSEVRKFEVLALRKLRQPSSIRKLRQASGMDSPPTVPPREHRLPSAPLVLESSCPTDYLEITQRIWKKLNSYNIRTIGDLAGTFPSHLRTVFSEAEISALQGAVTKMLAGGDEKFMAEDEKKLRGRLHRWVTSPLTITCNLDVLVV